MEIAERIDQTFQQAYNATHEPQFICAKAYIVMQSIVVNLMSSFPDKLVSVRLSRSTVLIADPNLLLSEEYLDRLKYWVDLMSEDLNKKNFGKLKLEFEDWYYYITSDGTIDFEYQKSYLLRTKEAMEMLNVSKPTLLTYVEQGLESANTTDHKKIPKHAVELWNESEAFIMQWVHQVRRMRVETDEDKLVRISAEIKKFEEVYEGPFGEVFGKLSSKEADERNDASNYYDWKDLEEMKAELQERMNKKKPQ